MLFQTLDDKNECVMAYYKDKLSTQLPQLPTATWNYTSFLEKIENIDYAQLYCGGKTLDEVCPASIRAEWEESYKRLKAYYRSMREAKLNLEEHCFFDMVPRKFLIDYCKVKNKITNYVLTVYEKPENYDFLLSLKKVTSEIRYKKINVNVAALKDRMHEERVRQFCKKHRHNSHYIKYDMFGTKTGRLSTQKGSFPILSMDKSYRKILKPNNDWFVEFDFNAAELRVLLNLLGKAQPPEDIHEWNLKNVFKDTCTREEVKKKTFAWLYNPESQDSLLDNMYDRKEVVKKYYDGKQVTTIFNRTIPASAHHALNYIIQSTTADMFLRQMIKVRESLEGKDSYIAFSLHDSIVLDFSEKNMRDLVKLKEVFEDTQFGKLLVNVSAGKSFGEMKKIKI